jgi:hypothetical protein
MIYLKLVYVPLKKLYLVQDGLLPEIGYKDCIFVPGGHGGGGEGTLKANRGS